MYTGVSRKTDGDFLRILGSFAVVLIHVIGEYVGPAPYSPSLICPATLNALSHISIPLFIMLSGRFMLSRTPSIMHSLKKAKKTAVQLLCWGVFYLAADILVMGAKPVSLVAALGDILTKPLHLWYFYTAISLYLMTPLLGIFTHHATQKQFIFALLFTFLLGSVLHIVVSSPFCGILPILLDKMKLSTSVGFIFCYLFGDYVYRYGIAARTRKILYVSGIILAIIMPTLTLYFASLHDGAPDYTLYSFVSPTVLVPAMGVFVWTKQFFANHTPHAVTFIRVVASLTPGIYGLHIFVLMLLPRTLLSALSPGLRVILLSFMVFAVSCFMVFAVKQIIPRRKNQG